jgi:hypothetical protein
MNPFMRMFGGLMGQGGRGMPGMMGMMPQMMQQFNPQQQFGPPGNMMMQPPGQMGMGRFGPMMNQFAPQLGNMMGSYRQ